MSKLITIRGYPGSGKTSVGKSLEKRGYGVFIDHNLILTFIAKITGDDDGIYDEIHGLELSMTNKLLAKDKTVIAARGFTTAKSVDIYRQVGNNNCVETIVIRLNVSINKLKEIVASPERKLDFNPVINPESLMLWLESNPMEDIPGESIVDATQGLHTVLMSVEALIQSSL